MPANYAEVMKDLEAREAKLLNELNTIKAAKPAIAALLLAQQIEAALLAPAPRGRYAGLGTTAALRDLFLNTTEALTREEIHSRLRAEGWSSNATDPLSSLSATLSQMKGSFLDKIEDRWKRKEGFDNLSLDQQLLATSAPEPPSWQSPSDAQA